MPRDAVRSEVRCHHNARAANLPGCRADGNHSLDFHAFERVDLIGGAGAFVAVAENFNSFGNAITKKLIAEIAQAEPVSAASHDG